MGHKLCPIILFLIFLWKLRYNFLFQQAEKKYGHNLWPISFYVNWLTSYIKGRQQFVKVGNQISRPINVKSSVAQGSHFGPLLFVININEISEIFDWVEHDEYADDLKFSRPIHTVAACVILQENIDRLQVFCANHQM